MATGRNNKIVGATGEYLVAAELSRRGLIATTFTGNVPDYDIVATDSEYRSILVQVKAITGTSWQFDFRKFANVKLDGKRQIIGRPIKPKKDIVCVLVALDEYGSDRFYILRWTELQKILITHHRQYLRKHGGVRPVRFDSYHTAVNEKVLIDYRDKWSLVKEAAKD